MSVTCPLSTVPDRPKPHPFRPQLLRPAQRTNKPAHVHNVCWLSCSRGDKSSCRQHACPDPADSKLPGHPRHVRNMPNHRYSTQQPLHYAHSAHYRSGTQRLAAKVPSMFNHKRPSRPMVKPKAPTSTWGRDQQAMSVTCPSAKPRTRHRCKTARNGTGRAQHKARNHPFT